MIALTAVVIVPLGVYGREPDTDNVPNGPGSIPGKSRRLSIGLAFSSVMLAAFIAWNFVEDYACIVGTSFTYRTGLLSAVKTVELPQHVQIDASCGLGKDSSRWATMRFRIPEIDRNFVVPVIGVGSVARQTKLVTSLLNNQGAIFLLTSTVNDRNCPPAAFALLNRWSRIHPKSVNK